MTSTPLYKKESNMKKVIVKVKATFRYNSNYIQLIPSNNPQEFEDELADKLVEFNKGEYYEDKIVEGKIIESKKEEDKVFIEEKKEIIERKVINPISKNIKKNVKKRNSKKKTLKEVVENVKKNNIPFSNNN